MKKALVFLALILVVVFYTHPFFQAGYFPTHDGEWAVIRLAEMEREIKDGQIPPRWSDFLNHGYGYPLFLYTYPFPFYLGMPLRGLHISLTNSIKIIFISSVFFSAVFMYLLGKSLAGDLAGLAAAVFYTIAPYRLANLYLRGSIGESVSLAVFVMLLYFGYQYLSQKRRLYFILASIFLGILVITHNVMALFFMPIWFLLLIFIPLKTKQSLSSRISMIVPVVLLGLGLSAYFFIPALAEKRYIILSNMRLADINDNFINFQDLLFSSWSAGTKPSYQLGRIQIIATLISFLSVIKLSADIRKKYLALLMTLFWAIVFYIFLANHLSSFFWSMPPLSWLDFPWRLLAPLVFLLALSVVFLFFHKIGRVVGIILVIFALFSNFLLVKTPDFFQKPDSYYQTNDATTTSADELMPVWLQNKPRERYVNKVEIESGKGVINYLTYNSRMINFGLKTETGSRVKINTIYFPGWNYHLDGKPIDVSYETIDGLVRFDVSSGIHQISGELGWTPIRMVADLISAFSLMTIFLLVLFPFRKRQISS